MRHTLLGVLLLCLAGCCANTGGAEKQIERSAHASSTFTAASVVDAARAHKTTLGPWPDRFAQLKRLEAIKRRTGNTPSALQLAQSLDMETAASGKHDGDLGRALAGGVPADTCFATCAVDFDSCDWSSSTYRLFSAAGEGDVATVSMLLDAGAALDDSASTACAPSRRTHSALDAATQWRRPQVVELMLARGAHARGCRGATLLSTAILGGQEGAHSVTQEAQRLFGVQLGPAAGVMAALLAAGAPPTPPPGCDQTLHPLASTLLFSALHTVLHPASVANATDRHAVLRLLLDAGADVNANNNSELLTSVISIGDVTAVRMLLRAGVNVLVHSDEHAEYAKSSPNMAYTKTALGQAINTIVIAASKGLEDAATTAQLRLIVAELQAAVRRVLPQADADAAFLRGAHALPSLHDPSARPAELLLALAAGANPSACVPVPSPAWARSFQRVPSPKLQYVDSALRAAGAGLIDDECASLPGGGMRASLRMLIIVADNSRARAGRGAAAHARRAKPKPWHRSWLRSGLGGGHHEAGTGG